MIRTLSRSLLFAALLAAPLAQARAAPASEAERAAAPARPVERASAEPEARTGRAAAPAAKNPTDHALPAEEAHPFRFQVLHLQLRA